MLTFAAIVTRRGLGLFLIALTVLFGAFAVLPLAAPALAAAGFEGLAQTIFVGFSVACHQMPERSFFLFGHQVAVCQRELGIYAGLFGASLVYHRMSERMRPMPLRLYVLAAAPLAIDGLTQMLGMRESDWLLRVATGLLFGASTVWVFFPRLSETRKEVDIHLAKNLETPRQSVA